MQAYTGRDIGGVFILSLQAFFHVCQVDQIQHLTPVNVMLMFNGVGSIFNGALNHLHLFNAVLHQLLLKFQVVQHKMIIRVVYGHFANIIQ